MAYEGEDPFDSGCINAIRCFQDICRYTGMELKGQAYGTALEPGAILANKKLLDEARELGRILYPDTQSLLSEQKATSTQYLRISATGNAAERDSIRPKASGRRGRGRKLSPERPLPDTFLPYRKYDASRAYSVSGSIGLARCSFMPALRDRSMSSAKALAVMARMGTVAASARSRPRMA